MSSPLASHPPSTPPPRSQPFTAPKFISHNSPSVHSSQHRRPSDASFSASMMDVDPGGDGEESINDVDQDIDELLSSSDERPPASPSGSGTGSRAGGTAGGGAARRTSGNDNASTGRGGPKKMRARATKKKVEDLPEFSCRWDDCEVIPDDQESLINHLHEVHAPEGLEEYRCQWFNCPRKGHKQSNRTGLITHVRIHTGEKPYKCPQEGCDRAFTRNDAMNKHLRTFHAEKHEELKELKNKEKKATTTTTMTTTTTTAMTNSNSSRSQARRTGASGSTTGGLKSSDKILMDDADLIDVLPRLRNRKRFWTITEDDEKVLAAIRSRYPRPPSDSREYDEEFDLGRSRDFPERCPEDIQSQAHEPPSDSQVIFMGRSQWQVRYIIAKAKLMLVEEENAMRKAQLMELMEQEAQLLAQQQSEA
ncbi:hypothetical protein BD324DRAFT_647476 [Kockovaella imperatae]|uniref:C2H2-type domain-containing protein n=1 Tax=Kockovaella imperatae TaxID=4999 RepID=A0A1Y1UR83_9TREE|nr:hypothetical protein BD324DRAFT_647476 [Kockovaella imperatae]ORX40550.1 hypothetical protein BD324DRAFT_647476 [Kockovaella imperatae]